MAQPQLDRSLYHYYDNTGRKFTPTTKPSQDFSPEKDAETLCTAMRCFGTDEEAIIKLFGNRTSSERVKIAEVYSAKYNRSLVSDFTNELSGHFCDLCILLTEPPIYLMAKSLYYAMKGVGTNENTIIEILISCSNEEIRKLKDTYVHVLRDKKIKDPKRTLESDIRDETSGYFRKMLLNLLKAETPEPTQEDINNFPRKGTMGLINKQQAAEDAKKLRELNGKSKQVIEQTFLDVFTKKSIYQLSTIAAEYERGSGQTLVGFIWKNVDKEYGLLLKAMVEYATNRSKFYSDLLFQSMVGQGTHDFLLMRVMILRSEIDLFDIKKIFDNEHESLEKFIKEDTSGDYQKMLLALMD